MKPMITQFHALYVNQLARRGHLVPFSNFDWVWRTDPEPHQARVNISAMGDELHLIYKWGPDKILQRVRLAYSIGSLGGKRPWFVCTTCRRRVGVLYHANERPFLCRTCLGLAYPSQYRSKKRGHGQRHSLISDTENRNRLAPWAKKSV